jgi:hypothetical protein
MGFNFFALLPKISFELLVVFTLDELGSELCLLH